MIRSKKITEAARGQDCTLNIVGVCNHNPATVVLCHFPDETHGMGQKSCDLSAGFGCSSCHDAIDGRMTGEVVEDMLASRDWYLRRSQTRTMRKLIEMGVVKL